MANRKLSVLAKLAGAVLLACSLPASASIPRDAASFPTTHPISTIRQSDGAVTPLLSDAFGNVVASVTNGTSVLWNAARVGGYGPLPGSSAAWLSTNTTLAAATVWRGKRMDPTGYYWMGARYYDPAGGRFLSPDPLGHDASMDLYSYADGDPINGDTVSGLNIRQTRFGNER